MNTECTELAFAFQPLARREVVARFNGGTITSDAGGLLLREVEANTGLIARFARCFDDFRDPELIDFTVEELLKQRVFALCLGYEDLIDHEQLRRDPLLATLVGRDDPTGQDRSDPRDRGCPLAGKSTLNRLELTPPGASAESRYKKIAARHEKLEDFFIATFIALQPQPPEELVLDFDATDNPLHGHQLGRFFHGYYDSYCYLPLYVFSGEQLLCAKLRPSNIDASAGALKVLQQIVAQLRAAWPAVKILVRGDSGFCRDHLMTWCENSGVDYLFGLAKNVRLLRLLGKEMVLAREQFQARGEPTRVFADTSYRTLKSWSRTRRVVGKAEHLAKGANPRFVVTSLSRAEVDARTVYEDRYCARGEMENRIKEQKRFCFAGRTSCQTMRANQLRLWLSSLAYVLLQTLRQFGLRETPLATARGDTIRLKLLKIGALVNVSVRRVFLALAASYPYQALFAQVWRNLQAWRATFAVAPPSPAPD